MSSVTGNVVTNAQGQRQYQVGWTHQSPRPAALFAVWALRQGVAVAGINMGGIGTPWNPPPVPDCYPVMIGSDSEGKFGHQCPSCRGYWRSRGGPVMCPYCGTRGDRHVFLTEAQGLPRSSFYDAPAAHLDDTEIVDRIRTICDEFEAYGYRRVGAELRHQGIIVNHKKVRRLMRECDLLPKRRRRYVATTDSDHDSPIFPDRARDLVVDGPNQLWVADITYIAITSGFVYLAAILDAWSRRVPYHCSTTPTLRVGETGSKTSQEFQLSQKRSIAVSRITL
jgi:HTH-like domain